MRDNDLLVSASDSVKFWKPFNVDNPTSTWVPNFNSDVSTIKWNPWGKFLITAGKANGKILLYKPQNIVPLSTHERISALDCNGRYILGGSFSNQIFLWDLKSLRLRRTYSYHKSPVLAITFCKGSAVSASTDGHVVVCDINTSKQQTFQKSLKNTEIISLQSSKFHRHFGSLDVQSGNVTIWDVDSSLALFHIRSLHAPTTASELAFSPTNHMLALTVGADAQLSYIDVNNGTKIKSVSTSQSLTSVVFSPNTNHVLCGTIAGSILLFDLRNSSSPVNTFVAHDGHRINCLTTVPQDELFPGDSKFDIPICNNSENDINASNITANSHDQKLTPNLKFPGVQSLDGVFSPENFQSLDLSFCGESIVHSPVSLTSGALSINTEEDSAVQNNEESSVSVKSSRISPFMPKLDHVTEDTATLNMRLVSEIVHDATDSIRESLHRDIVNSQMNAFRENFRLTELVEQLLERTSHLENEVADLKEMLASHHADMCSH